MYCNYWCFKQFDLDIDADCIEKKIFNVQIKLYNMCDFVFYVNKLATTLLIFIFIAGFH